MTYLLNVVYLIVLVLASPWLLLQSIRKGKYRRGWSAKLLGRVPTLSEESDVIWFHAVSVGEVNLLQPLIERLEEEYPNVECVISTTTQTGWEVAKRKYAPRTVFYCPLDFSWSVKSALRRVRPKLLVLVELEIWPNLIHIAHSRGVPIAIINGRLSEKSHRGYRRLGPVIHHVLERIDLIAVQTETYARRFVDLGAREETVAVTGSIKFDRAETDRLNEVTQKLGEEAGIQQSDSVFVAGNTQPEENRAAIQVYRSLRNEFPSLKLILVPRHPETFEALAEELRESGEPWQRRTELDGESPIIVVDVVGELGHWWGLSDIGFVGGSWGRRGGQNMIEPAAYGTAVSFGPKTSNFRDVVTLLKDNDACQIVRDESEMHEFVRRCLCEPEWAEALGQRARDVVLRQQGATSATLAKLVPLMKREE